MEWLVGLYHRWGMPIFGADSSSWSEGGESSCLSSHLSKHLKSHSWGYQTLSDTKDQHCCSKKKKKGNPNYHYLHSQTLVREIRASICFLWCSPRAVWFFSSLLGSTGEFVVFYPQLPLLFVAACPKQRTCYAFQQQSTWAPQTAYWDIQRSGPLGRTWGLLQELRFGLRQLCGRECQSTWS